MNRRQLLRGAAGASAAAGLLVAAPRGALARPLGPRDAYGTSRESRLFPGSFVAHADLHNHSLLSDGAGDPELAFADMRAMGLDVAALTDHSTVGTLVPGPFAEAGAAPCALGPDVDEGDRDPCQSFLGLDAEGWRRTGEFADAEDRPGEFTAIRGFEWSSPTLGHMNCWFSETWTDPLSTAGLTSPEDLLLFAEQEGFTPVPGVLETLGRLIAATPIGGLGMAGWYGWLQRSPSTPGLGGGSDALVGFNHPGREPLRFSDFAFEAGVKDRVVSMEIFNRQEDYLFRVAQGRSPLVSCLDAGWRVGLLGVTDQHGTSWGIGEGLGRGGYYVEELSRDGVRAAMLDRRFFATNLEGLRLDAAANGVRMGRTLGHVEGPVTIDIDIDRGPQATGTELIAQVLTTGPSLPRVLAAETIRIPGPGAPLPRLVVDVDADDVPWLVLRISDPSLPPDDRADDEYAGFGAAIAYASPWFVDPTVAAPDTGGDTDPVTTPPDPVDAPPEPAAPRPDTPAGEVARTGGGRGVPDRGPLPVTGSAGTGVGAALLGAAAGLLALRRRQEHADAHAHDHGGGHAHDHGGGHVHDHAEGHGRG